MNEQVHDEILEEWDVYINTELTPFLHLTPFPSRTLATRFNHISSNETSMARFKPLSRLLELHLPFTDLNRENLEFERLRDLQLEKGQKIAGMGWQWRKVQYLLGSFTSGKLFIMFYYISFYSVSIITLFNLLFLLQLFLLHLPLLEGELHMTPIESVIPLNPCLSHLDEFDARMKGGNSNSSSSSGTASRRSNSHEDLSNTNNNGSSASTNPAANTTNKAIQVQFRKKETEEQVQARLNSFAYLQRRVDDESWIELKHFPCTVKMK
jgi:hypothetical protein